MNEKINFDFLFENTAESAFTYDNETSRVFFEEIIKSVGLNDWNKFTVLCDLPLTWLEAFTFEKSYEFNSDGNNANNASIDDNSNYYRTFLHLAASVFPDKYANFIAQKIVKDYLKEWNAMGSLDTYNRELIKNLLERNQSQTFQTLKNENLIQNKDFFITMFYINYDLLQSYGNKLLKNEVVANLLLGSTKENKEGLLKECFVIGLNRCGKMNLKSLALLIQNLNECCPHKKNEIREIIVPFTIELIAKYTRYLSKEEIQKVGVLLIGHGLIDMHTEYSTKENRFLKEGEINMNKTTIESIFSFTPRNIENAYQLKAELLELALGKNKINVDSMKKNKI